MGDMGVLLLCFDVPATTKKDAKTYRSIMKMLKDEGFIQLQESVYVKLLRHFAGRQREMEKLKAKLPAVGRIFILPLRLGDLKEICTISGTPFDVGLFSDNIITF